MGPAKKETENFSRFAPKINPNKQTFFKFLSFGFCWFPIAMERRKCRKIPLLRVMRFPTAKERRKSRNRKRRLQRKTPAPAASSSASPPPWIELPEDVTVNILQRLGAEGMLSAELVCSSWWKVCKDPALWRVIDLCNPDPGATNLRRKYTAMCRRAVDRSQGQLLDLTMDSFGNGHLIKYVAHRSRYLKRLKLVSCIHIAGCLLVQAVEKLGQLEELHLNTSTWISARHIEAIGNACPKMKSFSFSEDGSWCQLPRCLENGGIDDKSDWNRYARAIGKCMPNLHHLQLCSFLMQNEGLAAILDGCPRLESLNIRQCFGLDLEGDLGKRCREQIKDMRLTDGPGLFNFVYDYL